MTGAEVLLGIVITIAVVGCFAVLGPWKKDKPVYKMRPGDPFWGEADKRRERKYGNDE